jgi:hypothetical protein
MEAARIKLMQYIRKEIIMNLKKHLKIIEANAIFCLLGCREHRGVQLTPQ